MCYSPVTTNKLFTKSAFKAAPCIRRTLASCIVACLPPLTALADNPLVSHIYTADPAAVVFDDRVYVVTSHDKDNATSYDLTDYCLFSSDDMVNWQDHGIIFDVNRDTTWANRAYAPDMIKRNGKYYLIFPNSGNNIGILESDNPDGPYTDIVGGPLIGRNVPNASVQWLFDPGAFLDDDNTLYITFGGGGPGESRIARISDDLKSVVGPAISIDAPNFFEASYMHKKGDTYYYSYSTNFDNGAPTIDYMTSDNPTSGFQHRGTILPNPPNNNNNNNHASIIEYKGQDYIFYHNRSVSGESYRRSINVDLLAYSSDGSIKRTTPTTSGVPQVKNFDPFRQVEAETMDTQSGVEVVRANNGTVRVEFNTNSWLKLTNVDFDAGANFIEARVAASSSTTIDIHIGSTNSAPVGSIQVPSTGGLQSWQTVTAELNGIVGVEDLYFKANGRVNMDWYQFVGQPVDCGEDNGTPVCCNMSADPERDGWGVQFGEACKVTNETNGYAPLNPSNVEIAINVGGAGDYFDDIYYQSDRYHSGGEDNTTNDTIQGAGDSSVFNSERYGDFSYSLPVDNGEYNVTLHFVEMYWDESGSRSFNVSIEDKNEASSLDIFRETGHDVAFSQDFVTTVSDGTLDIDISGTTDNGTLSAILVEKQEESSNSSSSSTSSSSTSSTSSSSSASTTSSSSNSSSSSTSSTGSTSSSGGSTSWLTSLMLMLLPGFCFTIRTKLNFKTGRKQYK